MAVPFDVWSVRFCLCFGERLLLFPGYLFLNAPETLRISKQSVKLYLNNDHCDNKRNTFLTYIHNNNKTSNKHSSYFAGNILILIFSVTPRHR